MEIGDIVMLKCGDIKMVIENFIYINDNSTLVQCCWHDKTGQICSYAFDKKTLVVIENE